jgi:hypothetical protein
MSYCRPPQHSVIPPLNIKKDDAAFIAAWNPETASALCALLREMGEALEVAFNYDGDVFGIHHNDATDALIKYKEVCDE